MALVDHKQVMDGLIDYIREQLSGQLSEMPTAFGSMPSVIRDRAKSPRPDFPYIVVDRLASSKEDGSWLRHMNVTTDDIVQFESEQRIPISITCYGENSDNILNALRQSFLWDLNRFTLNEKTNSTFQYCSDISDKPLFMETDFIDGAEMQVDFLAVSVYEVAGSVIETVEVTGIFKDGTGDESPIVTEFTISI